MLDSCNCFRTTLLSVGAQAILAQERATCPLVVQGVDLVSSRFSC